jgi:hypothetical protein
MSNFRSSIGNAPVSVLLTSNLSEASRMSLKNEISAYRQFLISEGIKQNSMLVIKPHPRDDINKIQKLKHALSNLYTEILVLSEPDLFFLPFEVFFAEAFVKPDLTLTNEVRVFATSSACLSLRLLFNVPSVVGFGEHITPQFFYKEYVTGRLKHELQLNSVIK